MMPRISQSQRARAGCLLAWVGTLAWMACKSPDTGPTDMSAMPTGSLTARVYAPESVLEYATVILDGGYSTDSTAAITAYSWQQSDGTPVKLTGPETAAPSFVAPAVTMPTALTFTLTVSNNAGASASTTATVQVLPAEADQLTPRLVDLSLFQTFTGNVHNDLQLWDGPPLGGSTLTAQATLSGAVATPRFSLVDENDKELASPSLALAGSPWLHSLTFAGPVQVPSVPFKLVAAGTSADGKPYSLASAMITPMKMSLSFDPPSLLLAPGASQMVSLKVHNGGSDATFAVTFKDPGGLLAQSQDQSLPVAAGQTAALPLSITMPAAAEPISPVLEATAAVTGDASRTGKVKLQAWRNRAR
jgi:hypothetical protein